ncbi:MAG TPA: sigma-54-dependent Fis family transcriptional regulator, partial [Pirellulaceae bacterium]|nr:sigma-54-dependent Fis family transcriptional regulator [Pirellulaceae bacterium]
HESDPSKFLNQALPLVAQALGGEYAALVQGHRGRWRTIESSGPKQAVPSELLSETLDGDRPVISGDWYVGPLTPQAGSGELLAIYKKRSSPFESDETFEKLSHCLATALTQVRSRQHDKQQIARQAALLEIAAQWTRTQQMDKLLSLIAEASTKLLHAERASIFLWDRTTHTLVGRPALGVDGGELRIADDTGIVGQVIHSGQPRRIDADIAAEQQEIDRRVDQRLKFQTRSLVCVPLVGQRGELFGAFELVNKVGGNFTDDDEHALTELAAHAAVALENTQEWEQLASAQRQIVDQAEQGVRLIGECPAIQALRSTINRVAETDLAVLILGQNGTGKEVVAQMIHYRSRRRQEPLLAVNCAALTETLLESELFGHEKGAFTDAREMRRGKFELAARGTLFLDEIGDMSLGGQAKLLRVLEEKIIVRVGGSVPIPTNTRVLAATNQNLTELVRARRFREDLYFRLNVVTLDLPPLAARGEDVILLAENFLKHFSALARRRAPKFTVAARKRLLAHAWPDNVRELRNLMERLAYLSPEEQDKIDAPDLAFIMSPDAASAGPLSLDLSLADATQEFQREFIKRHIDRARGNMTAAAEQLGLHRSNLYRKMRQLEMETGDE